MMEVYGISTGQQAMVMLRLWINSSGSRATGNELERVLRANGRDDIVRKCIVDSDLAPIQDRDEIEVARRSVVESEEDGFVVYKVRLDRHFQIN